jgi:2-oxoglutarate dehydrogenase E1 component
MSDQSTPSSASVYTAYQGNSYLFGGNAPYVEEMYENYLANPGSVPDNWRDYFDALQHVPAVDGSNAKDVPHLPVVNAFAERAKQGAPGGGGQRRRLRNGPQAHGRAAAHRRLPQRGRPLGRPGPAEAHRARQHSRTGAQSFYGFSDADQETVFNTSNTYFGRETMTLRELLNALRETYCGTIGAEFMYSTDQEPEALVAAAAGKHPQQAQLHAPRRRSTSSTA